jgi:hypothetical protein
MFFCLFFSFPLSRGDRKNRASLPTIVRFRLYKKGEDSEKKSKEAAALQPVSARAVPSNSDAMSTGRSAIRPCAQDVQWVKTIKKAEILGEASVSYPFCTKLITFYSVLY